MHPLDLNLASRPFRNNTLLGIGHGLAAVLLAVLTSWTVSTFIEKTRQLNELDSSMTSAESRLADLKRRSDRAENGIRTYDVKYLEVQAAKANDVIVRKALSWTKLFNLMENLLPYEVRMVSIRPVYRSDKEPGGGGSQEGGLLAPEGSVPVSVEGDAQTLDAFLEFERALLQDTHFDRVEPERSLIDKEKGGRVAFELRFEYFPEGRPRGAAASEEPGAHPASPAPSPPSKAPPGDDATGTTRAEAVSRGRRDA